MPLSAAYQLFAFAQSSRDRQHERDSEIGGSVGQHIGRIGDEDAELGGRGDIDVVVADRAVGYNAQIRGRL